MLPPGPRCVKANKLVKRGPTGSPLVTLGVLGAPLEIMTKVFEARRCHVRGKAYGRVWDCPGSWTPRWGIVGFPKPKGHTSLGCPLAARVREPGCEIIPVGDQSQGVTRSENFDAHGPEKRKLMCNFVQMHFSAHRYESLYDMTILGAKRNRSMCDQRAQNPELSGWSQGYGRLEWLWIN